MEDHRDRHWCREEARRIENAIDVEGFVERVGFASCLTDARRPGPSLYIAVCGRRDAVMPRNVQTDPETSLTWTLKDEVMRRGRVYYGKLARGKATFIAPRLIPHFNSIWGVRRADETSRLSRNARRVLKVLRGEWEMGTADLRNESGIKDRRAFTTALDELQTTSLGTTSIAVCSSSRAVVNARRSLMPRVHDGAGRAAGRDARRPERSRLSADVYIYMDARGRALSGCAETARRSRRSSARNRPLVSGGSGHDAAGRTGARDRPEPARRRTRKPSARCRRIRNDVCGWRLHAGVVRSAVIQGHVVG